MKRTLSLGAALFAALLFVVSPLLARGPSSTTADALRRIGLAAIGYAQDYDQRVVLTQQSDARSDLPWSLLVQPYLGVAGSVQAIYFDPSRPAIAGPSAKVGPSDVPWYSLTTLSINDAGYTGSWSTVGGTCAGRKIAYRYGQRSLATMADPASRVAFAPTKYDGVAGHEAYGWTFFHSYDASWIRPTVSNSLFSWNNLVWSANVAGKVPVVHADGSVATLTRTDFRDDKEAKTAAQWCAWIDGPGGKTWGRFYKTD